MADSHSGATRPVTARVVVLVVPAALLLGNGCREDPPIEGLDGETPTTIYAIQTPHGDTAPPALGSDVFLRSVVVSAFDTSPETTARREQDSTGAYFCVEEAGYTGAMVVQEMAGGTFSGVSLFNPTVIPAHLVLGPGDLVDVRGEYLEFCLAGNDYVADSYCAAPNSNRLTQLGSSSVTKVGEAEAPEPLPCPSQTCSMPGERSSSRGASSGSPSAWRSRPASHSTAAVSPIVASATTTATGPWRPTAASG
jgi:hypothetical protein